MITININTDNAIAINAELNDPLNEIVLLPPGLITVESAIVVPSGKTLRGAGVDVTIIERINYDPNTDYLDKALVRSAENAIAPQVSDMTLVSPKVDDKVQGVWMRGAQYGLVERVKTLNCGYAFWAQEGARFVTFRDVQSFNANVHFEATAATDVLFENMTSGDGDGDNPQGVEAVWHPLFGSKRVTFRHGRHVGAGSPFYVVADSGVGDEGLIDDILFDDCRAVNTDGKIVFYASRIDASASIGRVRLRNCVAVGGNPPGADTSIMIYLDVGEHLLESCDFTGFSAQNTVVGSTATLAVVNSRFKVSGNPAATGAIFGGNGRITVDGGTAESTTALVGLSFGNVYVSPSTRFISLNPLAVPVNVGRSSAYAYPVDLTLAGSFTVFGEGSSQPAARFTLANGVIYRVRFRGRIRKTGANGSIYVATNVVPAAGGIAIQLADGSFPMRFQNEVRVPANLGDERNVMIDMTIIGTGIQAVFGFGDQSAVTLKGAAISIERLS